MIYNTQWYTAITSSFKFILSIKGGKRKLLAKYLLYDLRVLIRTKPNNIMSVPVGCLVNCNYNVICLIDVNLFGRSSGSSFYR